MRGPPSSKNMHSSLKVSLNNLLLQSEKIDDASLLLRERRDILSEPQRRRCSSSSRSKGIETLESTLLWLYCEQYRVCNIKCTRLTNWRGRQSITRCQQCGNRHDNSLGKRRSVAANSSTWPRVQISKR